MRQLLPPNSTPLEQRLADVLSEATELQEQQLRGLKLLNPPTNWHHALVWEYGLNELQDYLPPERIIAEGLAFFRIRGTPLAVKRALSWGNIQATLIESPPSTESHHSLVQSRYQPYRHFAEYELELTALPDETTLCKAVKLAKLGQPLRSRLWRLRYGYNRDVFRLDHNALDDAFLTDDSGRFIQPACLPHSQKVSFQQAFTATFELGNIQVQQQTHIALHQHLPIWVSQGEYLDDESELKEVYFSSTGSGTTDIAPAVYHGQHWTAANWTAAADWQHTTLIASVERSITHQKQ